MRPVSFFASVAAAAILLGAPRAGAADLAAHSRIGAIFAEEPQAPIILPPHYLRDEDNAIAAQNVFAFQQRIPGYYGRPRDFYYQSYYGTPPETIYGRNPYACTILGWC